MRYIIYVYIYISYMLWIKLMVFLWWPVPTLMAWRGTSAEATGSGETTGKVRSCGAGQPLAFGEIGM
jgi:hypothetical protein